MKSDDQVTTRGPIGLSVLGAGNRARAVLSALPGIGSQFVIYRALDPRPHAVEAMAKATGCPITPARTLEEAVQDPRVQWVLIASPNACHAEQAVAALEAGKHVFCEKPLATTIEDALRVVEAARESRQHLVLGFVLRYTLHYRTIAEALHAGRIGSIISFEFNETLSLPHGAHIHGNWRRFTELGGGHLLEKCCHDLDLAHWLVGHRPRRVASFGGRRFFTPDHRAVLPHAIDPRQRQLPADQWFDEDHIEPFGSDADIVDHQTVLIEFENGVQATFHTNCATAIPERRLYVCGTQGTLRADITTQRMELCRFDETKPQIIHTATEGNHGGGDIQLARRWAGHMLNDDQPLVGVREGVEATVTALAIEHARRTGQVEVLDAWWERVDALLQRQTVERQTGQAVRVRSTPVAHSTSIA